MKNFNISMKEERKLVLYIVPLAAFDLNKMILTFTFGHQPFFGFKIQVLTSVHCAIIHIQQFYHLRNVTPFSIFFFIPLCIYYMLLDNYHTNQNATPSFFLQMREGA